LNAVPFNHLLGAWALRQANLLPTAPYVHVDDTAEWTWEKMGNQISIWNPSPELAHQAITSFLDLWVERSATTSALFLVPRILQRDWGFLSKHVIELGVFDPRDLP
jgi:hypothetical protein